MCRFLLVVATAVVAVAGLSMFNSCTGPQGPAGATVHDTLVTHKIDTLVRRDTIVRRDSVFTTLTIRDTTFRKDTVIYRDTVYRRDSVFTTVTIRDTTVRKDTVLLKDTTYIFRDTTVFLDTVLMGNACAVCHGSTQSLVAKQREWEQSDHSAYEVGNSFDYAGTRAGCMPCHNGSIYPGWVAGDKDSTHYVDQLANAIGPNCRTCHQIHSDYDSTDWALTTSGVDSVQLIAYPSSAPRFVKLGKGNLCVVCHQARGISNLDTMTADSAVMFARTQAHHGPQVNIVAGIGGYEFTGQTVTTPKAQTAHITEVADGCVECHVSSRTGMNHNFLPTIGACKGCHSTATTFNIGSTQTIVDSLTNILIDSLDSKGLVIRDSLSVIGISVDPLSRTPTTKKWPKKWVGAAYNLFVVVEDRSSGVHNSAYIQYLLKNSIELVQQ